jgi:hypothetical protein
MLRRKYESSKNGSARRNNHVHPEQMPMLFIGMRRRMN